MIYKHLNLTKILTLLLVFVSFSISAQITPEAGKKVFKNYCGTCHSKNMVADATGPALYGSQERWGDDEALYSWIRNSSALIATGYPRAVELKSEWKTVMTAFPSLTDDEIGSVLLYIDLVGKGEYPPKTKLTPGDVPVEEESSNTWLYILLLGVLGLLAIILTRIINNLNVLAAAKEGKEIQQKTLIQSLTSKGIVSFLIFALVVLAGYTTVTNATNLGRQQGYQPDQPIKFSHETHAGIHKIECQYCHDGARRSKHSVIPAANTCMNCHRAIKVGTEYGTAELTKIYASIGYDPTSNTYLENYDAMSEEEIKDVYTKWIEAQYLEKTELVELDADGKSEVNAQWKGIKNSLTNEQKKKIQGPIEWIRIHNLPDHVYFNHAQHVTVGEVECQDCHGTIEKMEVVQQHSPLSMGWCINCHRQTGVKFNDNEYYKSYSKYHEDLKSGAKDKVTVADIGGLECQKCHY
ncbi:MAG: c-type cytochrome [Saprospiraceae bacterium]|nr:c-type cytochrome [Saprospiraceae bacterium]